MIRDHLGNGRTYFSDIDASEDISIIGFNELIEENHYYPFGLEMEGPWITPNYGTSNPYTYNNKEWVETMELNWFNYGARWHDPAVARWWSLDPLAEKFYSQTPYNYTFNNPVKYIDPMGMAPIGIYDWRAHKSGGKGIYRNADGDRITFYEALNDNSRTSSSLRILRITVTNEIIGDALVSGYSHQNGRADDQFEVPLYKMTLEGVDNDRDNKSRDFSVIRFGVLQYKTGGPATVVGLADEQEYTVGQWRPNYLDGNDDITPGAWRIRGRHLLHDGADDPTVDAWGAIGCVEVCGENGFARLNWLIRLWSGTAKKGQEAYQEIVNRRLLKIKFQKAKRPILKPIVN